MFWVIFLFAFKLHFLLKERIPQKHFITVEQSYTEPEGIQIARWLVWYSHLDKSVMSINLKTLLLHINSCILKPQLSNLCKGHANQYNALAQFY